MPEIYLVNGKVKQKKDIGLPILKRGFLFGDGIFETIISKNYSLFRFFEHYERLKKGADFCGFRIPPKNEIEKSILKYLKKFRMKNGYIRINIWRKKGERVIPEGKETNILIILKNFTSYPKYFYEKGISCIISEKIIRNEKSPLTKIKSFNFLENIIGKIEAKENGCEDTIFLNNNNFLTETTVSNLFLAKNNIVYTPSLDCGILNGITRKIVIEICQKNKIKIKEGKFTAKILSECDEIFITNTLMGIIPVRKVKNFFQNNRNEMTDFIMKKYIEILKEETIFF